MSAASIEARAFLADATPGEWRSRRLLAALAGEVEALEVERDELHRRLALAQGEAARRLAALEAAEITQEDGQGKRV